jgi:drug/metabolite transporter (DMT)-like permease
MHIGFILAFIALLGISNASVIEKYLIVNKLNPVLLAGTSMLIASSILFLLIFLFKFFNIEILGDLSFKNTFSDMASDTNFLVAFLVLCCICATTKLCIFTSLKLITPFQLNIILSMMPIMVLLSSSLMKFDTINFKTIASLILFLLAIAIQIFL